MVALKSQSVQYKWLREYSHKSYAGVEVMDKFSRLIVVSEHESLHNLTLLAQSVGIKVEQSSKVKLLCAGNYRPDVLLACPYNSADFSKKGPSAELHYLLQRCSLFLFQAERSLIDPMQAIHAGIRGVIYRDEQLDRVMTALKTMIDGQLYYARPVMSAVVDQFLAQQAANRPAAIVTPENNLLTRQEKRIIQLVAEGARNKEIAEKLHISAHTVKAHLSTIFRKTQSRNRVELLRWLQQPQRQEPVAGFRLN